MYKYIFIVFMKKTFLTLLFGLSLMLMIGLSSCESCQKTPDVVTTDTVEVVEPANLHVEYVVSTDRQYMYVNYGGDYRWFESCITLQDFIDDEECDGTVASIANVFQVVEESENGADVHVVLAAHTPDTTAYEVKHGFWVEDEPLNEEAIVITFEGAFERMMEANCPKPHSKQCVLRKQVGPVDANPQYIFGNSHAQVYVDATTGDVNTDNPVFPEAQGFKMPLGEWP